ncbi:MAG TPA: 4Fe-4S binding protein [Anaerolineae bacterium]|nr:4Fe-4S binding protein [Anaerolineae bacterium]
MKFLSREALQTWLDRLANEATLIAPRLVDGILLYRSVSSARDIVLDYTRPKMSAKEVVLPSSEPILLVEKRGQDVNLSEPPTGEQVVFGLRPCDAHGIAVLDAVFVAQEPVDLNYARRRNATTLVGLSCPQMWEDCFCTSMGGMPNDPSHVDVLLTEVENGYAVTTVTDKGRTLVAELSLQEMEYEPPESVLNEAELVLTQEHWPDRFADQYWDLLAERCLECRMCAYLCPVCRCFDVRDQVVQQGISYSKYDRLRCWDSCTGANYRMVAGGHNPRATKGQRLRNRFFCKFHYFPVEYGLSGCVGCGRCIEACPVNIDIVEVLRDMSRASNAPQTSKVSPNAETGITA